MRIEQLLRDGAETHGAKPALVAGRVAYTFTDVDRKSDRLAAALVQRGLTPGSRVALFLDHSVPAIVSVFAILKAGCVVCPVEPSTDADLLKLFLMRGRISAIVTEPRLAATTAAALVGAPDMRVLVLVGGARDSAPPGCLSYERVTEGPGDDALPSLRASDAPAALFGGAVPEGRLASPVTHAALLADAAANPGEGDQRIADLGLTSRFGFCVMLAAFAAGAAQVVPGPGRAPFRGRRGDDAPDLSVALAG